MPCSRCNGMGSRIESPCADCRGEGRRNETTTLDGAGAGRCRGRFDDATERPRAGRSARRPERSTVRPPARPARPSDSNATATTCTTRRTSPSPRPCWARPSRCRRCARARVVDVAAGSANGTVHRLRHEGVEHLHGRGRGDLYVHLVVDVPTELDDDLREPVAPARRAAQRAGRSRRRGGLFHRRQSEEVSHLEWPRRVAALAQFRVDDPYQPVVERRRRASPAHGAARAQRRGDRRHRRRRLVVALRSGRPRACIA